MMAGKDNEVDAIRGNEKGTKAGHSGLATMDKGGNEGSREWKHRSG